DSGKCAFRRLLSNGDPRYRRGLVTGHRSCRLDCGANSWRLSTKLRRHREARVLGSDDSPAGRAGRSNDGEFKRKGKPTMKIDIFNHIFPKKFFDKYIDAGQGGKDIGKRVANIQTIVDVDSRMRILDEFGDYVQVLTLPLPPLEILA